MKAVLCADNVGMSVVDGRKLEVVVAREDLQAGIPEVLAHGEPCGLVVEWGALGPSAGPHPTSFMRRVNLGMSLELQWQFTIHQMELEKLFMPWGDFMV